MDCLIANYASSDEEDANQEQPWSKSPTSLFSSLPPPSRNFASLSPPRNSSSSLKTLNKDVAGQESKPKPSALFGSLPPPKPHNTAKRLVEFKPPISYAPTHHDDDGPRRKKRASSNADASASASAGGLSALLPPPKNTPLGAGAPDTGHVGRRSLLEIPCSSALEPLPLPLPLPAPLESNSLEPPQFDYNNNNYSVGLGADADPPCNMAAWSQSHAHGNGEVDVSVPFHPTISASQDEAQSRGKAERRGGRNQIPLDIIEVKQDELMRNRPREDQVKLTGIAFGPAYKPVSASKDKPSKLHKRKHQIGSLYYDLKQKEMELAERRARGQLTKAETQAKYGW